TGGDEEESGVFAGGGDGAGPGERKGNRRARRSRRARRAPRVARRRGGAGGGGNGFPGRMVPAFGEKGRENAGDEGGADRRGIARGQEGDPPARWRRSDRASGRTPGNRASCDRGDSQGGTNRRALSARSDRG